MAVTTMGSYNGNIAVGYTSRCPSKGQLIELVHTKAHTAAAMCEQTNECLHHLLQDMGAQVVAQHYLETYECWVSSLHNDVTNGHHALETSDFFFEPVGYISSRTH